MPYRLTNETLSQFVVVFKIAFKKENGADLEPAESAQLFEDLKNHMANEAKKHHGPQAYGASIVPFPSTVGQFQVSPPKGSDPATILESVYHITTLEGVISDLTNILDTATDIIKKISKEYGGAVTGRERDQAETILKDLARPIPYTLYDRAGNNIVHSVVPYQNPEGKQGFKIQGANASNQSRSVIIYHDGTVVSGYNGSPQLGI